MLRKPSALAPFKHRGYTLLWLSSLGWHFGRWMDTVVSGWLALMLTDSAWHVALIGFFRQFPVLLFGAFAGAISDRFDRRRLLIVAELLNIGASFAVAFLFVTNALEYWHLALANLVLGLSWSVEFPARRAMVPDLIPKDLLVSAILLDTVAMNSNKIIGPLAGGGMIAAFGITGCYVLLGSIYGIGLVPLLALRVPSGLPRRSASGLRFLVEGVQSCRRYASVRGVLMITVAMNIFAFTYLQLLPVVARDVLHVGPTELGLLTAGDGIGSTIGALLLMRMTRLRRQGLAFVAGSAITCSALVAFSVSPLYLLSLTMLIIGGVGHAAFSTFQSTIILQTVGEALRGRAMGLLTLAIGTAPLGMLFIGAVATALSAPWAIGLSGALGAGLVLASAGLTPELVRHRSTTTDQHGKALASVSSTKPA